MLLFSSPFWLINPTHDLFWKWRFLVDSRCSRGCGSFYTPAALLAAAALFVHKPFFSRLRLCLFTSRCSRGCGSFYTPSVLLAAAALFVHQPLFSRLRLCLFTSRCSRDYDSFYTPVVLLTAAAVFSSVLAFFVIQCSSFLSAVFFHLSWLFSSSNVLLSCLRIFLCFIDFVSSLCVFLSFCGFCHICKCLFV